MLWSLGKLKRASVGPPASDWDICGFNGVFNDIISNVKPQLSPEPADENPCVRRMSVLSQSRQQADRAARRQSLPYSDFSCATFIDENEFCSFFLGLNQSLSFTGIDLKSQNSEARFVAVHASLEHTRTE